MKSPATYLFYLNILVSKPFTIDFSDYILQLNNQHGFLPQILFHALLLVFKPPGEEISRMACGRSSCSVWWHTMNSAAVHMMIIATISYIARSYYYRSGWNEIFIASILFFTFHHRGSIYYYSTSRLLPYDWLTDYSGSKNRIIHCGTFIVTTGLSCVYFCFYLFNRTDLCLVTRLVGMPRTAYL